jgi:catechol 2,3-dioxygenase-like lactoylglutathione lyase family enzyme
MDSISELGDQLVVEIFVRDLDRSLAIYTALGFTLERRDGNFAALSWEGREFFLDQRSDLAPASARARHRCLGGHIAIRPILDPKRRYS